VAADHPRPSSAYPAHRAIVTAIGLGDGDLARTLTEEHILDAIDRLVCCTWS